MRKAQPKTSLDHPHMRQTLPKTSPDQPRRPAAAVAGAGNRVGGRCLARENYLCDLPILAQRVERGLGGHGHYVGGGG